MPTAAEVVEIARSRRPDGVLVWERAEGESDKGWAAFQLYRDAPARTRSLQVVHDAVYGEGAGNLRQIERWSSSWAWAARVRAWDDHKSRVAAQESLASVQATSKDIADVAGRAARVARAQLA